MSWFVGILKRVFVWEENESSDRRNPRYSDHGLSSVNVGVSYPRAPSGFSPSKPPSSINQCQSSSGSPASSSKLPTSSSNLSPSSSLLGPQNTAGSFTPTKPPSSINQCQSSSGSPASISKLPTSSSNLSSFSSLLGPQNTAKKTKYIVADKDIASIYVIPDSIKDLIKKKTLYLKFLRNLCLLRLTGTTLLLCSMQRTSTLRHIQ